MGRYLRGTNGFSYKYAFAAQDDNLAELADASGAGRGGLMPVLGGGYRDREENFDIPVIAMLRAIQADGKAQGGEIAGVVRHHGNLLPSSSLEFVQYALGENLIEVVLRLDLELASLPFGVNLEGYAAYEIAREDYGQLAAYIDRFRPAKLDLVELRDEQRTEKIAGELGDSAGYLPAMALWILRHAVVHDLPAIAVYESQPGTYAPDFWQLVAEWGPDIFNSSPSTPDAWFVRGLCEMFRGDREVGQQSLAHAASAGFARANRWLDPPAAAKAPRQTAVKKPKKKPAKRPPVKKPAKKPAKKTPMKKKQRNAKPAAKRKR